MNQKLLKLTTILLLLVGIASSCNPDCPPDCPDEYPKNISFTEYSLLETSCQWQNLPYDEKVIIINSSEELEKYISCTEGDYPAIDFSKHSLLLTSGSVNNSVAEIIVKSLKQVSFQKCILNIELDLKYKDDTESWCMALMVEKLNDESSIKLNVVLKTPEIIRPVTITDGDIIDFFNMALPQWGHSNCFFTLFERLKDTCIIINNMDEFRYACECTDTVPEIDFRVYTLIIAKKMVFHSDVYLIDQWIINDDSLTLYITMYDGGNGALAYSPKHRWGIYPKLPNKPFSVKYIELN
ncbi:MAG: hypothetical protein FWD09_02880 [Lentimicrobiaceae bacterium]|nr:hypothetical protein [Lentimicrobiaceae bacterium]